MCCPVFFYFFLQSTSHFTLRIISSASWVYNTNNNNIIIYKKYFAGARARVRASLHLYACTDDMRTRFGGGHKIHILEKKHARKNTSTYSSRKVKCLSFYIHICVCGVMLMSLYGGAAQNLFRVVVGWNGPRVCRATASLRQMLLL